MHNNSYTANDIDVLEGLEGVRKRPSIYVGDINKHALFQIIKEAVDNAVDEALIGANDRVYIQLDRINMSVLVADAGRGIPVEIHFKTKISTLTTILTRIHAGGKFSGKEVTVGTHGVGISATNALSAKFEVWTNRAKSWRETQEGPKTWYYQSFEKGIPTCEVQENVKPPLEWKCGTVVQFIPDPSIFIKNYRLPVKKIEEWLYCLQYLCPGLEFTLCSLRAKNDPIISENMVFKSKNGIPQWVNELVTTKELTSVGKKFEYSDTELQVALQWTNADDEHLLTYVNCCPTIGNGSHFEGFRKALNDALSSFSEEKYSKEDLRIGLVGVLHFKMKEPTYDTQTKERLSSDFAENKIKELLTPALTEYFSRNRNLADTILTKAVKLKQARERFKKDKDAIKNLSFVSKTSKHVLPAVLLGAPYCKPEERELFICEGKSAQGTLKNARDPKYQEVLPLKGKFTNAAKFSPSKVLQNEDIRNIFTAIGSNQNIKDVFQCNPKKARVGKILWLPDEDEDGKHIRCLGLTLMLEYMKELIISGMVYIVNAPLFITSWKDKKYYGKTLQDIQKQLPKGAKVHITRMKGWGEAPASDMKIIACNPNTRSLFKVELTDKCVDKIEELMGSDSASRRKLLGIR
jgi:DNA gyrase/topoisomerase IV subunit B